MTSMAFKAASAELPPGVRLRERLRGSGGNRIRHLAWAPDGERLAVGYENGTVRIWNLQDLRSPLEFRAHEEPVLHLAWATDCEWLATAGKSTIEVWSTRDAMRRQTLLTRATSLLGLAWAADAPAVRAAFLLGMPPTRRACLGLWSVENGLPLSEEIRLEWDGSFQAISADSRLLALLLPSGRLEVWSLETGERIADWPRRPQDIFSVALAPNRQLLGIGFSNGSMETWDLGLGRTDNVQLHEGGAVFSASFSPDGRVLASKSSDGTICFTRCDTWDTVAKVEEPQVAGEETEIAFSGRQSVLATLDKLNTSVRLLDVDVPTLLTYGGDKMIPIVFFSADPASGPPSEKRDLKSATPPVEIGAGVHFSRLRLDEELREIQAELRSSNIRDRLYFQAHTAVRPEDLSRALLSLRPCIVQFSGHGGQDGAIYLEDRAGLRKRVTAEALAAIFKPVRGIVECVVLNACHSATQAKAIARHVPYVIGMRRAIGDPAAIAFSTGFYQAVGAGFPIPQAFDAGCALIALQGIPENLVPVLTRGRRDSRRGGGALSKAERPSSSTLVQVEEF